MIACRKSFTDTLLELAKKDKDIIAVTSDARGSVTLGDFADQLPEQLPAPSQLQERHSRAEHFQLHFQTWFVVPPLLYRQE